MVLEGRSKLIATGGAWLAQSGEHATLDLGVLCSAHVGHTAYLKKNADSVWLCLPLGQLRKSTWWVVKYLTFLLLTVLLTKQGVITIVSSNINC